jgi:hypothetical protein
VQERNWCEELIGWHADTGHEEFSTASALDFVELGIREGYAYDTFDFLLGAAMWEVSSILPALRP